MKGTMKGTMTVMHRASEGIPTNNRWYHRYIPLHGSIQCQLPMVPIVTGIYPKSIN